MIIAVHRRAAGVGAGLLEADRREVMLALFTVMFVSAIVFTLSGFLFRGPGFKMYLPWQMPNGYNPFDGL